MVRYIFRFYNGDEVHSEMAEVKWDTDMKKRILKKFLKGKNFSLSCKPGYYLNSKNINFIKREEIND